MPDADIFSPYLEFLSFLSYTYKRTDGWENRIPEPVRARYFGKTGMDFPDLFFHTYIGMIL